MANCDRETALAKLADKISSRGPMRRRRGSESIPIYVSVDARCYRFLQELSARLHQTQALTMEQLLTMLEEDRVFCAEQQSNHSDIS